MLNLKTIVATDQDGLNTRNLVITLEVLKDDINIEQAVMNACTEYCQTEEGKWVYCDCNCFSFNWGDFVTHVPKEICENHGFKIFESEYIEELQVDFNQQLVDEYDVVDYE